MFCHRSFVALLSTATMIPFLIPVQAWAEEPQKPLTIEERLANLEFDIKAVNRFMESALFEKRVRPTASVFKEGQLNVIGDRAGKIVISLEKIENRPNGALFHFWAAGCDAVNLLDVRVAFTPHAISYESLKDHTDQLYETLKKKLPVEEQEIYFPMVEPGKRVKQSVFIERWSSDLVKEISFEYIGTGGIAVPK